MKKKQYTKKDRLKTVDELKCSYASKHSSIENEMIVILPSLAYSLYFFFN